MCHTITHSKSPKLLSRNTSLFIANDWFTLKMSCAFHGFLKVKGSMGCFIFGCSLIQHQFVEAHTSLIQKLQGTNNLCRWPKLISLPQPCFPSSTPKISCYPSVNTIWNPCPPRNGTPIQIAMSSTIRLRGHESFLAAGKNSFRCILTSLGSGLLTKRKLIKMVRLPQKEPRLPVMR